jgi:hypothetical protein
MEDDYRCLSNMDVITGNSLQLGKQGRDLTKAMLVIRLDIPSNVGLTLLIEPSGVYLLGFC